LVHGYGFIVTGSLLRVHGYGFIVTGSLLWVHGYGFMVIGYWLLVVGWFTGEPCRGSFTLKFFLPASGFVKIYAQIYE